MEEKIASLLTGIEKSFPFRILYYSHAKIKWGENLFPPSCSVLQQVSRSGIPCYLSLPGELCDQLLPCHRACKLDAVYFHPVYDGNVWLGTLCAWPDCPEKHHSFVEHGEKVEPLFSLLSSYIISHEEKIRFIRENGILRQEMRNMLGLTNEMWLIVNHKGLIMEVSQHFCTLIGLRRANLISEDIDVIIKKDDWLRLSQIPEYGSLTLELGTFGDDPTRGQAVETLRCNVQIRVIYENKRKESYVLLFYPQVEDEIRGGRSHSLFVFDDIIGISHTISGARELAERIAAGETTVMLRGESGTGKEIFAQAIHTGSTRSRGSFVAINCAAIPETLLESELFGYEKGAFTGAQGKAKPGRFELANGGTIFLDEIGDMSLGLQAKLLRVVQDRKLERLGSTYSINVDVRIIAATHRRLEEMVATKQFREDLYYRLNVIPLTIPPLRERKEDIPILVEHFMKTQAASTQRLPKRLSPEAWGLLLNYAWPGNIRELKNVVEHFMQLEIGDLVTAHSLPDYLQKNSPLTPVNSNIRRQQKHGNEKERIMGLLDNYGRHVQGKQRVAAALNWSLPTLYRRMKKYGIK